MRQIKYVDSVLLHVKIETKTNKIFNLLRINYCCCAALSIIVTLFSLILVLSFYFIGTISLNNFRDVERKALYKSYLFFTEIPNFGHNCITLKTMHLNVTSNEKVWCVLRKGSKFCFNLESIYADRIPRFRRYVYIFYLQSLDSEEMS